MRSEWRVDDAPRFLEHRFGETAMRLEPVHHTIVAIDVAGSGSRYDLLQLRMRADLREIVTDTLALQSVDLAQLHQTDLGDGMRLLLAGVSPVLLLDPFVPNLATA